MVINIEQMSAILAALPDPAFLLSRSGKYLAIFGGKDARYYHDGSNLVGHNIQELIKPDKAAWFINIIAKALASGNLLIEEYELSNKDVKGLPDEGPVEPIWFEGRIQALDFMVDGEDVVLWVASNISKRHNLENQLREQSTTDQLTGLFNRRKMETELSYHFAAYQRHGTPLSIIMIDLDHLKKLNDSEGHHAGDKAICGIAEICKNTLRQTDIACRFGGDEFVIVLPNVGLEQAAQTAERLRKSVEDTLVKSNEYSVNITISLGVATIQENDQGYEEALKRADKALYQVKHNGRNRVIAQPITA
ncbi:diguanylate cyclase [Pseudoalteromonas sp. T1lg65]|uniref:GGDEF domain-containing protein n=1 Tax=Pseudoalteromonas sp. T1lg65 TaxID=2077101 RepID=UPI003F78D4EA